MSTSALPVTAYLGLGSNLDQPRKQLRQALQALQEVPQSRLTAVSRLYRSPPLQGEGVPAQADYLNMVVALATTLPPRPLLDVLHAIERQQGRVRPGIRWGPRQLDIDILLYGHVQQDDATLTLPHPGLATRAFVLYPLRDCVTELVLPDGRLLSELLATCPAHALTCLGVL